MQIFKIVDRAVAPATETEPKEFLRLRTSCLMSLSARLLSQGPSLIKQPKSLWPPRLLAVAARVWTIFWANQLDRGQDLAAA